METKPSNLATWIVGIVLVLILAALILPGFKSSQRASNERGASAWIKTLAQAEADFRGNDRDKNGVQDFWTKDVAGLFHLVPPGETEPIRLIELGTATADPTQPGATARVGYWFQAMDKDEEGQDYRQGPGKNRHPSKFAFCAYPAHRSTGTKVIYINEDNMMFRKTFEGPPRLRWFKDSEIAFEYSQND